MANKGKKISSKRLINVQSVSLIISIVGILFLSIGAGYAIFSDTFKSDKKQVVEVGTTKIELVEPSSGLSLGNVEELSDSNGLVQTNYYSFSVKNTGDSATKYNLYLLDDADTISTYEGTLLADKYLRVGLDKNGEELGPLNLDTQKRLIDTGVIEAGSTNNYKLRLWLNFEGLTDSEKDVLDGQSKFLKLKLTGEQNFSNTLADTIIKRDLKTNKNEANGLFSTNDTSSGKPTYYYKGAVDNNYVTFANMLWRIVRVNEDGSIRLISNDTLNNNTNYVFSTKYDSYKYMYYSETNYDGGIMKVVNDWYNANLMPFDSKIATSSFCEAAHVAWSNMENNLGSFSVTHMPNYKPSLKCDADANGKKDINLKAGLLMVDEALLAGIPFDVGGAKNPNTYLQPSTDKGYWLISLSGYIDSSFPSELLGGFYIQTLGKINHTFGNGQRDMDLHPIRVVISINDSTIVSGDGSSTSPFVVK